MGKLDDMTQADETPRVSVTLTARQEKTLLRPQGSRRHAVFSMRASVEQAPAAVTAEPRRPLTMALTLDRSGSMAGEPLRMAKQVAIALIDGMTEQDEVAVVIFDDDIETLQELAPVTPAVKERVRRALERVEARGSTALHEAWLTSCNMLASDHMPANRLARCYLLTDGQANVGETDVETIATQAAGVRENAGVGTSAFGLGDDYNERLLGPWAVAGGGQFHDLRSLADLADTFLGERDELRAVVALRTRLEVEMAEGMSAEAISAYWRANATASGASGDQRWRLDIGDLLNGEERHAVVRFSFPKEDKAYSYIVRARVIWIDGRGEQFGPWQELTFQYGSEQACADEPRDAQAMRHIGLAHADRCKRLALELSANHDTERALWLIHQTIARIGEYAGDDSELQAAMRDLRTLAETIRAHKLTAREAKATYFAQQTRSRGQRDYRKPQ
jgi:Ca-activated chloride channel homolog